MARKKQSEEENAVEPESTGPESLEPNASHTTTEVAPQPPEALGSLAGEVQAFLDRRTELAQKLAQEIEAAEQRLAELRRTAALLFPENGTSGAEKDRKEGKRKTKNGKPKPAVAPPEAPASGEPPTAAG